MKGFPIAEARAALAEDDYRVAQVEHIFTLHRKDDAAKVAAFADRDQLIECGKLETQAGMMAWARRLFPHIAHLISSVELIGIDSKTSGRLLLVHTAPPITRPKDTTSKDAAHGQLPKSG